MTSVALTPISQHVFQHTIHIVPAPQLPQTAVQVRVHAQAVHCLCLHNCVDNVLGCCRSITPPQCACLAVVYIAAAAGILYGVNEIWKVFEQS